MVSNLEYKILILLFLVNIFLFFKGESDCAIDAGLYGTGQYRYGLLYACRIETKDGFKNVRDIKGLNK